MLKMQIFSTKWNDYLDCFSCYLPDDDRCVDNMETSVSIDQPHTYLLFRLEAITFTCHFIICLGNFSIRCP